MDVTSLALLAQTNPTDALAGGAGWIGAGLLGLVLSWLLLRHLPAKDAQIERLLDRHEKQVQGQQQSYKESLAAVVAHCEKEVGAMATRFAAELAKLNDAIEKLGETFERLLPERESRR